MAQKLLKDRTEGELSIRFSCFVVILLAVFISGPASANSKNEPQDFEFFEKHVRPVLTTNCYSCHSAQAKKLRANLRLDSREGLLNGGDRGPAIDPVNPAKSLLLEVIRYENVDLRMPPKGKLPPETIEKLNAWVQAGAPWPKETTAKQSSAAEVFDLEKRKKAHWAWQPIQTFAPPKVTHPDWPRTGSDAFILARLEHKGLAPAAPADRSAWLRRVTFDLNGLPPRPEEVGAFLLDSSADAFDKVVDRLLASEHYGERWGRHWLDLVRYAEARGHEFDYAIANAYQYRDYVIRAFNNDVPYDQFVREHLAGDLFENPRLHQSERFNESILGTGFWFLGEEVHSPVDLRQDQADRFDNRIDVFGKTFLGLTVACARCHDHKFDAISARDYYALFGVLESSSYRQVRYDALEREREAGRKLCKLREEARPRVEKALAQSLRPGVKNVAEYLLAANEVQANRTPSRSEEVARRHNLDAATLHVWVDALSKAASEEQNPLHPFARLSVIDRKEPTTDAPRRTGLLTRPSNSRTGQEARPAEAVVDYASCKAQDWMPDGMAYGPCPVQPGDIRFSPGKRPAIRIVDYSAAEFDIAWDRMQAAPESEKDPGPFGSFLKAGRMIRTPTFAVGVGKVHCLVKGAAQVYAAVCAHTMIEGPLHGRLVHEIAANPEFHWVTIDLSPYRGQRAHLEFAALPGSEFAVAEVVQGTQPPAERKFHRAMNELLTASDDLNAIALAYQCLLCDALDRLAGDEIRNSPKAADYAWLCNWMVSHSKLFAPSEADSKGVYENVQAALAEESQCLASISRQSRLAPALMDGTGVDEQVFVRGSPKIPGSHVDRRFLAALVGEDAKLPGPGSGRLELARQVTDPKQNPFIARVIVNRVWRHLYGRGIVASVDNFGVLGEPPSHPELLDYLAEQFIHEGWSVKRLIRSLALSSAYRMSSHGEAEPDRADPDNVLLHRMPMRRLEGEAIRDAILAVSGRLDERAYGKPVPVHLNEYQDGRGKPESGPLDGLGRRSIYLAVRRNFLSSFLLAFDTPIPFSTVGKRTVSNVPAQALILLNDPFVHRQAEFWARKICAQTDSDTERITRMYLAAFARPPTGDELASCQAFLHDQANKGAEWTALAHVLFNVKEFIYVQ